MKVLRIIRMAAISLLLIGTSCNNEETLGTENLQEIRLTSVIQVMSRGTNLNQQSTQLENERTIGVTITGALDEHKNVSWTSGNGGILSLTNTNDKVYWGTSGATIVAYHPYNSIWEDDADYNFSVSTDQSTNGYLDSDLLWAKTENASKNDGAVELIFTHKMAKINVTLLPAISGDDLSGSTIQICGTNINAKFNPLTGILSTGTSSVNDIKAGVTTSSANTATAIIVPQTLTVGTELIKIKHGNNLFVYKLPTEKEFLSGNSYSYTLTLNKKTGIELKSVSITNWTNENIEETLDNEDGNKSLEITLTEAGTLSSKIPDSDKYLVTKLKVSGPINGTDIKYIREMAGRDVEGNGTIGSLKELDMKNATIVAGGDNYFYLEQWYSTQDNSITNYMFYECLLTNICLPNNVTSIGDRAFWRCKDLTEVNIPNNVTSIGSDAFSSCSSLKTVDLPNSINYIPFNAFAYSGLISIVIPEGVTEIASTAFAHCSNLTSVSIPKSVISFFGNQVFMECNSLVEVKCYIETPLKYCPFFTINPNAKLYVPKGCKSAYEESEWKSCFSEIHEM